MLYKIYYKIYNNKYFIFMLMKDLREKNFYNRGRLVKFSYNSIEYEAYEGENLAAALFACGQRELRLSTQKNTPRGIFCLIGSCQECVVIINKKKTAACQVNILEGMKFTSSI